MNAIKLQLLILLMAILASSSDAAVQSRPHADPLPIGNYVEDVAALLERAFAYDHWSLKSRPDENTFIGFISYKGYDASVSITLREGHLYLNLESAYATDCGDSCENLGEEPVIQWLVVLRRAIAIELTKAVRERLLEQSSQTG